MLDNGNVGLNFNPHSHEGSDQMTTILKNKIEISIHTPTRGATIVSCSLPANGINFNPHSRVGSDRIAVKSCRRTEKFQSTLPRGERLFNTDMVKAILDAFNPHSRVGSDTLWLLQYSICAISIHTPTRGATFYCDTFQSYDFDFNPHSHEGSDHHQTCC